MAENVFNEDVITAVLLEEQKERIKELEADVSKLGQLHIDECNITHKQNVKIRKLEAENKRLRKALEKTKASLVKYLRNTDALIYTEAGDFVLKIQQAIALQPEKEGE